MQPVSDLWQGRRYWGWDNLLAVFRRTLPVSCVWPARGRSSRARRGSAPAVDTPDGVWVPRARRPTSPSVQSAAWNAADRRAATRTADRGRPQRGGPAVRRTSSRLLRRGRRADVRTESRQLADSSEKWWLRRPRPATCRRLERRSTTLSRLCTTTTTTAAECRRQRRAVWRRTTSSESDREMGWIQRGWLTGSAHARAAVCLSVCLVWSCVTESERNRCERGETVDSSSSSSDE